MKNNKAEQKKRNEQKTKTTTMSKAKQSQAKIETVKCTNFPFPKSSLHSFVCLFHSCHFFSIHFSFQFRVTFITILIFFSQCITTVSVCLYLLWPFYRLSSSLNRNYPPSLTAYFIFAILYIHTLYLRECVFEFCTRAMCAFAHTHTDTLTHRRKKNLFRII